MAFAITTWKQHSTYIRDFHTFCERRELNIFECTPYIINLYILLLAQNGKTFASIEAFLSAISFVFKFYLVRDFVQDKMIKDMKRFVAKVCRHGHNTKEAFGESTDTIMLCSQCEKKSKNQ